MEGSDARGPDRPRPKRRFGAALVLAGLAILWLRVLVGTGDPYAIVWFLGAYLTCVGGFAVALGRAFAYRGDTWQAALVAGFASVLGPLSAVLLLVPPVWRSLREVPAQWRARREVPEDARAPEQAPAVQLHTPEQAPTVQLHTPEQAEAAHRQGASLALGLVAAAIAFWSSILISVWFAFASTTVTDGDWVVLSLLVAFVVGAAGFVGVLALQRRHRLLARYELGSAAGMGVAIVLVALDRGDLHWDDGNRLSVSFLYALWALVGLLFLLGADVAWRGAKVGGLDPPEVEV